ncbi:MAG: xanthine dehydrogenase family protein subunit M [Planctomycetes bacterium]|nr:xanthine dehydrogenase family protein subunit M [Planctomycetota bacterium]
MIVDSPTRLDDALRALERLGDRCQVIAGGTDLMVEYESGRTRPGPVLDIWRIDELRGIDDRDGTLRIGALTSCSTLRADPRVPDILRDAAHEVGAEQIRNRATIGGNLGTASPAADLVPVLFALGANIRLISRNGTRELPVTDFITGYRSTARRPDELIESIAIPERAPNEFRGFRKVGTRRAQSISKLVVAIAITCDDVVTAVASGAGSVAPHTIPLPALASELVGHPLEPERIRAAARKSARQDVKPIDDVRSTGDYRRQVLARVVTRILDDASGRVDRSRNTPTR